MLLLLLCCSLSEPETPRWMRGSPDPQEPLLDPAAPPPGSLLWCGALGGRPGWVWFAFDDRRCEGRSVSTLEQLDDAPAGIGCGLRWKGTKEEGFAGAGAKLQGMKLRDDQQLRLAMRGDGRRYRMSLPMRGQLGPSEDDPESCTSKRHDFYGKELHCGDGSSAWIEVVVPLKGLAQEGWGEPWSWKAADVLQLQVQAVEKGAFQCDFRLVAVEDG